MAVAPPRNPSGRSPQRQQLPVEAQRECQPRWPRWRRENKCRKHARGRLRSKTKEKGHESQEQRPVHLRRLRSIFCKMIKVMENSQGMGPKSPKGKQPGTGTLSALSVLLSSLALRSDNWRGARNRRPPGGLISAATSVDLSFVVGPSQLCGTVPVCWTQHNAPSPSPARPNRPHPVYPHFLIASLCLGVPDWCSWPPCFVASAMSLLLMLIVNGRVLGRSVQDLLRHFSVRQVGFFSQQHSMDSNDFWWSEEQFSV